MSKWIRQDDKVIVISGNDKGKSGVVLARKDDRVVVQGINVRKKHLRRQQREAKAEIASIEMPLHISNVSLCDENDKPIKVRPKVQEDGSKQLVYLHEGKEKVLRTLRQKTT